MKLLYILHANLSGFAASHSVIVHFARLTDQNFEFYINI